MIIGLSIPGLSWSARVLLLLNMLMFPSAFKFCKSADEFDVETDLEGFSSYMLAWFW